MLHSIFAPNAGRPVVHHLGEGAAVCHKPVKGSDESTASYKGATFYFASAAHRDTFLGDPDRYAHLRDLPRALLSELTDPQATAAEWDPEHVVLALPDYSEAEMVNGRDLLRTMVNGLYASRAVAAWEMPHAA